MAKTLHITQTGSAIGRPQNQRQTLQGLGLKMGRTVEREDTPSIRGMVATVAHLVKVETSAPSK